MKQPEWKKRTLLRNETNKQDPKELNPEMRTWEGVETDEFKDRRERALYPG